METEVKLKLIEIAWEMAKQRGASPMSARLEDFDEYYAHLVKTVGETAPPPKPPPISKHSR